MDTSFMLLHAAITLRRAGTPFNIAVKILDINVVDTRFMLFQLAFRFCNKGTIVQTAPKLFGVNPTKVGQMIRHTAGVLRLVVTSFDFAVMILNSNSMDKCLMLLYMIC